MGRRTPSAAILTILWLLSEVQMQMEMKMEMHPPQARDQTRWAGMRGEVMASGSGCQLPCQSHARCQICTGTSQTPPSSWQWSPCMPMNWLAFAAIQVEIPSKNQTCRWSGDSFKSSAPGDKCLECQFLNPLKAPKVFRWKKPSQTIIM